MKITAPNSWITTTLQEICLISMGQSPPSNTYNTQKIGLPFFQGKAEFTKLHPVASKWCSEPKVTADNDDVLISVRAPVGSVNIANNKCCIGRGLASIKYDPCYKFIYYYLITQEDYLKSQSSGSTFKAISGSIIKSLLIMLPSLPEQRAIVAKLEKLLSELDNAVTTLKHSKEQIKIYRQAVLKAAFSGKLTEEWRKKQTDLPTADEILIQIQNERQKYYEKQLEDYKAGKVQTKPKEPQVTKILPKTDSLLSKYWLWTSVSGVCNDIIGGGTPSTKIAEYWNGEIPWISSADIYSETDIRPRRHINFDAVYNSATNLLPSGNIIVVTRVGLGKLAITEYDICFSQDIQGLVLISSVYNKFILWILSMAVQSFRSKNQGTTISGVTKKQLSELEIPLCSYEEQLRIVDEIESRLAIAEQLDQSIDDSLSKTEALRQSLLKQAFEGKLLSEEELGQTRQAPDWEPAEKLLERIRYNKGR